MASDKDDPAAVTDTLRQLLKQTRAKLGLCDEPLIAPVRTELLRQFLYPIEGSGSTGTHVIIIPDVPPRSTDVASARMLAERALQEVMTGERKIVILTDGLTEEARAAMRPDNFKDLPPDQQWAIDKRLGILDWDGPK